MCLIKLLQSNSIVLYPVSIRVPMEHQRSYSQETSKEHLRSPPLSDLPRRNSDLSFSQSQSHSQIQSFPMTKTTCLNIPRKRRSNPPGSLSNPIRTKPRPWSRRHTLSKTLSISSSPRSNPVPGFRTQKFKGNHTVSKGAPKIAISYSSTSSPSFARQCTYGRFAYVVMPESI